MQIFLAGIANESYDVSLGADPFGHASTLRNSKYNPNKSGLSCVVCHVSARPSSRSRAAPAFPSSSATAPSAHTMRPDIL